MSGRLILVRHGQSHGNVARRLDTRPPGAELTDVGREEARSFARSRPRPPGLLLHSAARRAEQTAIEIGAQWDTPAEGAEGIHEVQAGDLEDRDDDEAIAIARQIAEALGYASRSGAHSAVQEALAERDSARVSGTLVSKRRWMPSSGWTQMESM